VRFLTTFHQQSTTISPSKNHVLHLTFPENPNKNAPPPAQYFISRYHKENPRD
jgi:hypothetical protein